VIYLNWPLQLIFPSLLRARPNGCGATTRLFPAGVSKRPLGRTVMPFLFIDVYKLPAGAENTISSFFVDLQEVKVIQDNAIGINNC